MKNKEKLYFEDVDSTTCHALQYFLDSAKSDGIKEITVLEAEPDTQKDFIWCSIYDAVENGLCGRGCKEYEAINGVRGKCKHKGKLYIHGEPKTFKVE